MAPVEMRRYMLAECASFRKTSARFGGLSNMAPGYPLKVNAITIKTSEALYQACRFPHLPDVQQLIISEGSPMTAKMKSRPYRARSRPDWLDVRVRIMRWCLRIKLAQNWERFAALLAETGDMPIVEESRRDSFWGAIPSEDGTAAGKNVLGRLLMELRQELRAGDDSRLEKLRLVEPPMVPYALILLQPISLVSNFSRRDRPVQLRVTSD